MVESDKEIKNEEAQGQNEQIFVEETMVPMKNQAVTVREEVEEDGKFILYNSDNQIILVINSTGKFILEKCTGSHSVSDIIAEIENSFSFDKNVDLKSIVKGYIGLLLRAQLITTA